MKNLTSIQVVLVAIFLTVNPNFCFATGGSGTGGNNTINGKSIEMFSRYPELDCKDYQNKCLPDFKEVMTSLLTKLKSLKSPLENILEERVVDMHWYLIPNRPDELPAEELGLPFKTDQSARQDVSRIFIYEEDIRESFSVRQHFYIHELVESLLPTSTKSSPEGALLVENLTSTLLDPVITQNKLDEAATPVLQYYDEIVSCRPYLAGTNSTVRAKKLEKAEKILDYENGVSLSLKSFAALFLLWGAPGAVPTSGLSLLPSIGLGGVDYLQSYIFRKTILRSEKIRRCMQQIYPNEYDTYLKQVKSLKSSNKGQ